MNRLAVFVVGLSVLAIGCGSSPTEPAEGTRTTTTFTVPLSSANEVPAITNADAGSSGTAIIALTVTKDGSGNISSATANCEFPGPRLPARTSVNVAPVH